MIKFGYLSPLALLAVPAGAQAQSMAPAAADAEQRATADSSAADPASIVVTARRREERLQDVPVAISVLSGEQLQRQNITSMIEFQKSVPSLTITPSSGRGNSANIMIRGQRQADNTIFADPSVQVYVNEVNAPRTSGLDTTAFDLESVQVLKGPEGTLFGRNSTGGAVLFTTRKPGDVSAGYLRTYVEDPKGAGIEGAGDLPIAEGVALRIAGNYQYRQGYTKVVSPGALLNTAPFNTTLAGTFNSVNNGQRLDDRNRWVGRATLDLKPTSDLRSTFVFEAFESDENGLGTFSFNYLPGFAGAASAAVAARGYAPAYAQAQALGFHTTTLSLPALSAYKMQSGSNVTSLQLSDGLTLKNVAGYRHITGHDIIDQDGTFANILVNDGVNGGRSYSEELQLQGQSLAKSLDWVIGGYYFHETGFDDVHTYTFAPPLVGAFSNNKFEGKNESLSVFAHFNYTLPFISARTRLYGGARYTHDKREVTFESRSVNAAGTITCSVFDDTGVRLLPTACALTRSATYNQPTFEIGIDHQWMPNSLLYATVSTGYRAGGFNGRATTIALRVPFQPEKVTNYEIGSKNTFDVGGAPVTLNLAAYYTNYRNIQRTLIIDNRPPGGLVPVLGSNIVNAATARIYGAEGEFSARPVQSFNLRAHFSYTNARYKSFLQTNPVTRVVTDLSANKFYGVPEWQWGAGFDWTAVKGSAGEIVLTGNVSHTDAFELTDINVPGGRSSSVTTADMFLNWNRMFGSRISSSVYVKNLFDRNYVASGLLLTGNLDVAEVQHGDPRVIGGMLRFDF